MIPAASPVILLFAEINRRRNEHQNPEFMRLPIDALHSHGGEETMTIQVGGLYFCSFFASSSVANPTYTVIAWPTLRSLTTAGGK
jgi:hypothetical protein